MRIGPFDIAWDGIMWGRYGTNDGAMYQYYFSWMHWLRKDYRHWGFSAMYYEGVHRSFGFWFFNWSWSTHWTKLHDHEGERYDGLGSRNRGRDLRSVG